MDDQIHGNGTIINIYTYDDNYLNWNENECCNITEPQNWDFECSVPYSNGNNTCLNNRWKSENCSAKHNSWFRKTYHTPTQYPTKIPTIFPSDNPIVLILQ